jgi:FMN-dependent NADH-azoreductase
MTTILHIDASAQTDRSISRNLSAQFTKTWLAERPKDTVIRRDLSETPPGFVTGEWIAACFTPEGDRTAEMHAALEESDELIAELEAADIVVLGTPMYNYGMPAVLKAWVDRVIRIGKTFTFDRARGDYPLEPIFSGKTLVALTSKGEFGFSKGGIREEMNHLDGHIEAVAHYLGLSDRHFIHSEFQEFADDRHEQSRNKAKADTVALANELSKAII